MKRSPKKKKAVKKLKAFMDPKKMGAGIWAAVGLRGSILVAGILLGWIGINLVTGFHPVWGTGVPCMLVGAVLMVLAFPARAVIPKGLMSEGKPKGLASPDPRVGLTLFQAWAWIMGALLLGILALKYYVLSPGWFLILGAASLLFWIRKQFGITWFPPIELKKAGWTFPVLMVFAALLRFPFLGSNFTGLQGDEVNNLVGAAGIIQNHYAGESPFLTGWGGTADLPQWVLALFFQFLGARVWVGRLVSVLASMVTLFFFYRWCRFWLGNLAAGVATLLFSISWWFLYFSFSPFNNSMLFMTQVMAFYFLQKGFVEGKKMDFWWSGICAAACVMNYVPGRGVPGMMFFTILAFLILKGKPFFKAFWKQIVLLGLGLFWFCLPYLIHGYRYPGEVWGRVLVGWIGQEAHRTGSYFFLLKAYFWTFATLWVPNSDADFRFAGTFPFLDPFTGLCVLAGIILCLLNLRRPITWVLLPGLFIGVSANALSIQASPAVLSTVHAVRYSTVLPFLFLAGGWGFEWLLSFFRKVTKVPGWVPAILIVAGLFLAMNVNFTTIYYDFEHTHGPWGERGFDRIGMSKALFDNYPKKHLMVETGLFTSSVVTFQTKDQIKYFPFILDPPLPIPYSVTKDVLILIQTPRVSEATRQKIHELYPDAVWTDYKNFWGEIYLTGIDIPMAEVQKAQEGLDLKGPLP